MKAVLFWLFREDFIKERADTKVVFKQRSEQREGASHVLCGERVPLQAEPPASAEARDKDSGGWAWGRGAAAQGV